MPEAVDNIARDRISDLDKRLTELSNDYWGPNKDNGTRSTVRGQGVKLEDLEREMRHYVDTLPERCLGLRALAAHEAECEETLYDETKEGQEVTIAKEGNRTRITEARLSLLGIVLVAIMSLIGTVIQAQQNQVTQKQLGTLTSALESKTQP